ncbi:DUF4198 domain-containing protein [Vibrio cincinnatiensis]|uniref:DUF4198 domain-containing protein n=1 Tax=Vibrio cincinnatiensis TaxID=675 RepID=UPI001EDD5814|nr:DUF4198 domain-containing protein [Vibrio cincinnatiensis]MCG3727384.1 carboxypeptidase regulatory-like domain-containing protein [Vibrio cincinnatiensis]
MLKAKQQMDKFMTISSIFKLKYVLPILLLIFFVQESDASMFGFFKKLNKENKGAVEVFPAVSGQLTYNNQPLKNVRIKRSYNYIDVMKKDKDDYTTTDEDGYFSFPEIIMNNAPTYNLAGVIIIWQAIVIDDSDYPEFSDSYLWYTNSRGIKHVYYFKEMLSQLNCELTNSESMLQVIHAGFPSGVVSFNVYSVCRWPEREKIEKQKQKDLELYDELKPAEHYGDYL